MARGIGGIMAFLFDDACLGNTQFCQANRNVIHYEKSIHYCLSMAENISNHSTILLVFWVFLVGCGNLQDNFVSTCAEICDETFTCAPIHK